MDWDWQRVWRKVQWSLAQRGGVGTLRVLAARALRRRVDVAAPLHPFDVQNGVDTSGFIGGGELSEGSANDRFTTGYHAIAPSRFFEALQRWKATPGTLATEEYAFLDVGCGKGRAMMLASEMPFREVVGVELSLRLAAIAAENLRMWQANGRARSPVRLIEGDATEVALPAAPLLVFLYNPFQAPLLRLLLKRLDDAASEVTGRIDVIYVVPSQEAVFAEFPEFERLWSGAIGLLPEEAETELVSSPDDRCSLYRR